jgi:hypothetical protein
VDKQAPGDSPVRCVLTVRDLPMEAFRLPDDGRKWKALCKERQALAMQLATRANPDGTRITLGSRKMAKKLGFHLNTLFARLDDLDRLGALEKQGYSEWGTRLRSIDMEWVEFAKFVFDRWEAKGRPQPQPEIVFGLVVRKP